MAKLLLESLIKTKVISLSVIFPYRFKGLHNVAYHRFLLLYACLAVQFCVHVCMYPTLHDLRTDSCVNVPSPPPSFGFDSAAGLFFGAVILPRACLVFRGALEDAYPSRQILTPWGTSP
jgi:hypothetical protein